MAGSWCGIPFVEQVITRVDVKFSSGVPSWDAQVKSFASNYHSGNSIAYLDLLSSVFNMSPN